MSGIFGLFNSAPSDETLDAMEKALRHRGPDGQGRLKRMYSCIGMTRLSVLDDRLGHQPFFSVNGRIAVVIDGFISNWRELRQKLQARGYPFRSECDAEVVPAAWEEWGPEMLKRFEGMFALALMEGEKLFLARDPTGQKPLYLAQRKDGSHTFASETSGLRAAGHPIDINHSSLEHWLALRYVPEPETLLTGIKALPAGHSLQWQPGSDIKIQPWWQTPALDHEPAPTDAEALTELASLLDQTAERCLQSDQPIAIDLTRGTDSALLLDAIHRAGGKCDTLTINYGDSPQANSSIAGFAAELGFINHEINLDASCLNELPRIAQQMGTPIANDSILTMDALARTCAKLNRPVLIGSQGPNELFHGHPTHQALQKAETLGTIRRNLALSALKFAPTSTIEARSLLSTPLGTSGRGKVHAWLASYPQATPWEKGMSLRSLFSPSEIRHLLLDALWLEPPLSPGLDLRDRHHRQQFTDWLPNFSLLNQDRNAMAHSIEYRSPILDQQFIAFSGQLGAHQKLRGKQSKWIWQELVKARLPRRIAHQPPRTQDPPLTKLAQSPQWKTLVGDLLSPETLHRDYIFRSEFVEQLKKQANDGELLPLRQLFALITFQIWKSN